jgi:signal transduction histidine kinase
VRAETNHKFVRVWVEDNGIGIPPEHRERIFGLFQRLHRPEHYAGTGVGLAIVKRAAERMGGATGVESVINNGSRFWIDLPSLPTLQLESAQFIDPAKPHFLSTPSQVVTVAPGSN